MARKPKAEDKQLGQPCRYKPEYCELLIEHMKKGLSFEAFGAEVNVSSRTLYHWQNGFPEFREAHEVGLSHSRLVWERMGMVLVARGGGNGSAAVYIVNMKNRFGWRDAPKDEPEALDAKEAVKALTQAERMELLKIARPEKAK